MSAAVRAVREVRRHSRSGFPAAAALLALTLALVPPRPLAAQQPGAAGQDQSFNFQNVELPAVLTALAGAAGINLVQSAVPTTQVTLRTVQPMPRSEIPNLIRQLARANGLFTIDNDNFMLVQGPLNQQTPAEEPRTLYVYRLKHARAPALAATLSALFGGALPPTGIGTGQQTLSQQLQSQEQQTVAAQTGINLQAGGNQARPGVRIASGELEGNVLIIPDELTNTLLVRANAGDWAILQQAIDALDLRPLQVVIEVVIAEVRRNHDLNLGAQVTVTNKNATASNTTRVNSDGALAAGGVTLDILRAGDIDVSATLSALATTGRVRILSRPVIQAQNNQQARILVGSERPFVQVSQTSTTGGLATSQIVQYRDVGTQLTLTPTINDEGYVNLALAQEISSATAETQFGAPIISTREATTQILARNGQTVVIGGLVDSQVENDRSGIPILKDIPILGALFGSQTQSVTSSELFLFLTPYVVGSDDDAARLRESIERNTELLKELQPIKPILPATIQPVLPDSAAAGAQKR